MPALTTQQKTHMLERFENLTHRFGRFVERAVESPADRAARLGAESALGSEQEIEDQNRRHRKELQNPVFAKNYFAAQRLTRIKLLRQKSMEPDRRNFCYRSGAC